MRAIPRPIKKKLASCVASVNLRHSNFCQVRTWRKTSPASARTTTAVVRALFLLMEAIECKGFQGKLRNGSSGRVVMGNKSEARADQLEIAPVCGAACFCAVLEFASALLLCELTAFVCARFLALKSRTMRAT